MMTSLGRFGDSRLEKGGSLFLQRLLADASFGISERALADGRHDELRFHRFLNNPRVTPAEMVATARRHLLERVAGRPVLVIQDTTSLRDDGDKQGVYLHPAIAVDAADGALLGLLHADFLVHDETPKPHANQRRLEQKESRRWIDASAQAANLLEAGARSVLMIADREADLYESFALRPPGVEVLVRVHHDRCLANGGKLYGSFAGQPPLGHSMVEVPRASDRQGRTARLAIHARQVSIKRPKRARAELSAGLPKQVDLTLVEAREIDPPADQAALHWRLLSSLPATTLAETLQLLQFYRRRWEIEQVFRVMKTRGFDIEAVALREDGPLKTLACITLIAAIQVQQMLHDRDGKAHRPMQDVFNPDDRPMIEAIGKTLEGKTQRQKNPHPRDRSPMSAGFAPAWADGPATMASRGPSFCCGDFSAFSQCLRE